MLLAAIDVAPVQQLGHRGGDRRAEQRQPEDHDHNYAEPAATAAISCLPGSLWCYPLECEHGHPWAPGRIIVAWMPCDCPPAAAERERGVIWWCIARRRGAGRPGTSRGTRRRVSSEEQGKALPTAAGEALAA